MAALRAFGHHSFAIETNIRQRAGCVEEFAAHINHRGSIPDVGLFQCVSPSFCRSMNTAASNGSVTIDDEHPEWHVASAWIVVAPVKPWEENRHTKALASEMAYKVLCVLFVFIQALAFKARHVGNMEVSKLHIINAELLTEPDDILHESPVISRAHETGPDDPRKATGTAPATEFGNGINRVVKQRRAGPRQPGEGLCIGPVKADAHEFERSCQESVEFARQKSPIRNQVNLHPAMMGQSSHTEEVGVGEWFAACEIHRDGPGETVEKLTEGIEVHLLE